jgi:hypothetical protein
VRKKYQFEIKGKIDENWYLKNDEN